jgi:hypothetical protein
VHPHHTRRFPHRRNVHDAATDSLPLATVVDVDKRRPLEEGEHQDHGRFTKQLGAREKKKQRLSRPSMVLQSTQTSTQNLYANPPAVDAGSRLAQPTSLYTILARHVDPQIGQEGAESGIRLTPREQLLLRDKGFSKASVEAWATCIRETGSIAAASVFGPGRETPPMFMLLLFLRRRHMSASALGVVFRHLDERVETEPLTWDAIKLLCVRLLRHACSLWPESIPWIASWFARQADVLFGAENLNNASPHMLSDVTRFCNFFLHLLSLPASTHPILGAMHQEKAQLQVLQFMASCSPAITVTRTGFRSVSRTQLAHGKTTQEREWAELKGPSWPPWKEDRTAMDEDKGYAFGASRATKILHRMYEAGYQGHTWEAMVEVYAGWDTDFSPTIQTRTSLPHISSPTKNEGYLTDLLWAARVRTTRTRREAWACFLAYEMSGARASQQVYLAMFEKLYYPASERSTKTKSQPDLDEVLRVDDEKLEETVDILLPGDMKEVVPESVSPLHYVYLSEPIPTVESLYRRMYAHKVQPTTRLLAFLIELAPSFDACIEMLGGAKEHFNGGIGHLLTGHHENDSSVSTIPGYLLAAFIKFLCQYGQFHRSPEPISSFVSPARHALEFKTNRRYLMDYAYAILSHYRPLYRPAWLTYMQQVRNKGPNERTVGGQGVNQYVIIWNLIEAMQQIDLDVDDDIFTSVCVATTSAAHAANTGPTSLEGARHVLHTGSPRLRSLFHNLVGANIDMQSAGGRHTVPPHIPGPAVLHAYVRALGTLGDYEGLYSFSTWLTQHHVEVTARAEAQHGGSKLLFRTLVGLRCALTGNFVQGNHQEKQAPDEIVQLIKAQIEQVEEWGGWPGQEYVDLYIKGGLKSHRPSVGGR